MLFIAGYIFIPAAFFLYVLLKPPSNELSSEYIESLQSQSDGA